MTPTFEATRITRPQHIEDLSDHTISAMTGAFVVFLTQAVEDRDARSGTVSDNWYTTARPKLHSWPAFELAGTRTYAVTQSVFSDIKGVVFGENKTPSLFSNIPSRGIEDYSQRIQNSPNHWVPMDRMPTATEGMTSSLYQIFRERPVHPDATTNPQLPHSIDWIGPIGTSHSSLPEDIQGTGTSVSALRRSFEAYFRTQLELNTHVSLPGLHTVSTDTALGSLDKGTLGSIPPELAQRLHQISQLGHNWNSYGAIPIAPDSIAEARRIIERGLSLSLPVPRVAPGSGASMSIEWDTPCGELIIDILPTKEKSFALVLAGDDEEVEGVLDDADLENILRQLVGSES